MTKRYDVRGMDINQIVALSAASLDECFEEAVDNAGKLCRDRGGTEEEIEAMREQQRKSLEQDRVGQLAKLRAWLERVCEALN